VLNWRINPYPLYLIYFSALDGIHTLVYTDNKDFIVGLSCWADNYMSYGVWTPEPEISEQNAELVWNYLEGRGFNRSFRLDTPYDKCFDKVEITTLSDNSIVD